MVKYLFNLKSSGVYDEDKATEIVEWTDDGKDDSVYAALGYNFEHDSDGHILFNGEFPDQYSDTPGQPVDAEIVSIPFTESYNANTREVSGANE